MPTCQNCYRKWNWKQTLKKSCTFGRGMKCPYCNEVQYYSSRFKKRSSIVPFIIVTLILLSNLVLDSFYMLLFISTGCMLFVVAVYPFFVELSNREESLW